MTKVLIQGKIKDHGESANDKKDVIDDESVAIQINE